MDIVDSVIGLSYRNRFYRSLTWQLRHGVDFIPPVRDHEFGFRIIGVQPGDVGNEVNSFDTRTVISSSKLLRQFDHKDLQLGKQGDRSWTNELYM